MEKEEFEKVVPFGKGREDILLVKRKGEDYWQMMNSDGDVWGKFYPYDKDYTYPFIHRTYELSEGERPFRVKNDYILSGEKYVDTNGYLSDHTYTDDSGYYRSSNNITFVKRRYDGQGYWVFRDCDGNYSQRVFKDGNGMSSFFDRAGSTFYDYCFEKDGKIKPLYKLETIQTIGNGTQLLMENKGRPIDKVITYGSFIPEPLYFFKDKNGELSESFYYAGKYNDGWAKVKKHYYDNHIHYRDENGNLSIPFEDGKDYNNGYAVVKVEGKYYCIRDAECNLSTKWFNNEYDALKEINAGNAKKYFEKRILDTKIDEEQLKSYYYVSGNYNGLRIAKKYIAGDYQFVDQNGNLSEPFYNIMGFDEVRKFWNSGRQVRDPETGHLSQEVYFVYGGYDTNGCIVVQLKPNGPYYLMDKDGNMSEPFGEIHHEHNGFRAVRKSFFHPYQIIDKNWHLSQKKYPDKDSVLTEILKQDFKFEKEEVATIKPRPKKVKQSTLVENKQNTTLISAMIDSNITSEVADNVTIPAPKTDLEKYLSNEISVYELDAEHFKGETLNKIIKHEKANYLQAITYFEDNAEKMADIRKQTLEITEYIKDVACELRDIETKQIDYKTAPIF